MTRRLVISPDDCAPAVTVVTRREVVFYGRRADLMRHGVPFQSANARAIALANYLTRRALRRGGPSAREWQRND